MSLKIYTDGSCIKYDPKDSSGPGGWGYVILQDNLILEGSGSNPDTTNNRMEMQAVIEALEGCDKLDDDFYIYTDSMLVLNCAQGVWKRKKNIDLWKRYDLVSKDKKIVWKKVKAHSGDKWNEYVDNLANTETQKIKKNIVSQ